MWVQKGEGATGGSKQEQARAHGGRGCYGIGKG